MTVHLQSVLSEYNVKITLDLIEMWKRTRKKTFGTMYL